MAGTRVGGLRAAKSIKKRFGKNYYKRIGSIGGSSSGTGGFFANSELARIAGAKGGRLSRRGVAKV